MTTTAANATGGLSAFSKGNNFLPSALIQYLISESETCVQGHQTVSKTIQMYSSNSELVFAWSSIVVVSILVVEGEVACGVEQARLEGFYLSVLPSPSSLTRL